MSLARTNARKCAVQALYQWQVTDQSLDVIEQQFIEEDRLKKAQKSYFSELFHEIPKQLDKLDSILSEFVDRPVERINLVERAILRIGTYEILNRLDIPYRVILNESINLARCFGAEGSHKYINGVLDKIVQKNRTIEIQAKKTITNSG
jgi:N utilization substance protein B